MALFKEIKQEDGVTTSYHRIFYVMTVVNHHLSIAVLSYTDNESRKSEKDNTMTQPYQKAVTYETAYDPDMTIEKAYEWLKTLPEFSGAVNV